jgi:hypothetical protein
VTHAAHNPNEPYREPLILRVRTRTCAEAVAKMISHRFGAADDDAFTTDAGEAAIVYRVRIVDLIDDPTGDTATVLVDTPMQNVVGFYAEGFMAGWSWHEKDQGRSPG